MDTPRRSRRLIDKARKIVEDAKKAESEAAKKIVSEAAFKAAREAAQKLSLQWPITVTIVMNIDIPSTPK